MFSLGKAATPIIPGLTETSGGVSRLVEEALRSLCDSFNGLTLEELLMLPEADLMEALGDLLDVSSLSRGCWSLSPSPLKFEEIINL